jgi:hypothetical protein
MDGNEEKEQRHDSRGSDGHRGSMRKSIFYAINVASECRVFPSMPKGDIVDRLGWFSLMSTLEASPVENSGSPRGVVKEPKFV